MLILLFLIIFIIIFILIKPLISRYDRRGFNRKGIHKNGTKFDDFGFDIRGFDETGYDKYGYNSNGFDKNGYNKDGYNICGKNVHGKYNRLYDIADYKKSEYSQDGFLNPRFYPIAVTNHARERIRERMPGGNTVNVNRVVRSAYCFGRSARQIKKTSAALIRDIESRYENGIVLIYNGFIYIFSQENTLITMYKNENIPL